jgi:hypothetical protein
MLVLLLRVNRIMNLRRKIMNQLFTSIMLAFLLIIMAVPAVAQDTLDVSADGIGTLNDAIAGDTLADGSRNPNRVYRLSRDAAYLITGSLTVPDGYPMRMVATNGSGHRPMFIPMTDDGGASYRHFWVTGDGEWKGLYFTNVDDLGNNPVGAKNMFRLQGEGSRYLLYDCYIDGDTQAIFRMNSADEKLFIIDCIFRNMARTADPWDGIAIAARGGYQDTIYVENSTIYAGSNRVIQAFDGVIKNAIFNHCTFAYFGGVQGGNFDLQQTVNLTFTNNVLFDIGFEGHNSRPEAQMLPIDSMNTGDFGTDAERKIKISNNVYGWSPEITAWIESKAAPEAGKDTLWKYVFQDTVTENMMANFPNMVAENNIMEDLVFSDPPDVTIFADYSKARYDTDYDNSNNPDMRVDRNGIGNLYDNFGGYGLAEDEFDFDYQPTAAAYTHAEGNYPAGDLNWFPELKAVWEGGGPNNIDNAPISALPEMFSLVQNYPNPFNPTTTIEYNLNKPAQVKMVVYNSLGQQVKVLVNGQSQKAGSYMVNWDGKDDTGKFVASGLYFYRLDADNQTMTKKMLMLK